MYNVNKYRQFNSFNDSTQNFIYVHNALIIFQPTARSVDTYNELAHPHDKLNFIFMIH